MEPRARCFTTGLMRETDGAYLAVSDDIVIGTALKILAQRVARGSLLSSPNAVKNYLRLRFADLQHEVFCLLYLDKRNRLIVIEDLFRGTIDGARFIRAKLSRPRYATMRQGLCIAHNHPGSCAEPSQADELITRRLKTALDYVDIRLIDHWS